jgi:CubicO group peptidase (beta-lactamase class C family)
VINSGQAQSLNKAKLDSLFDILSANNKAMGSIALSQNGKLVYQKAIGYSSIGTSGTIQADIHTRYRIGSITKTFTATLIFQLIEEGKLSLTTPLKDFYPQILNAESITISQLLNHRSGIHNFTDDPSYMSWMEKPKTHEEILKIIVDGKSDFQPDSKASYSNSNYILLGYIIEKITKKAYAEVLKEKITSKVGLTDTYYGNKTDLKKHESYSYKFDGNNWKQEPETDMSIPHAAGSIVSTPADLVKFIEALFANKLVKEASLLKMKTLTDGYGMGLFQFPFNGKKSFGHNGGIDGFASMLAYFPDEKLSIAYCTNGQVYNMNNIVMGALSIYFNKPYSIPSFKAVSLTAEDLEKYLGVYASSQIPLKITISKDNLTLMAQATGQSAFPLEAVEKDKFKFDQAQIIIEFNTTTQEMTLIQGGKSYIFRKEK